MRKYWLRGRVIAGLIVSSMVVGGIGVYSLPDTDGALIAAGAVIPAPNAMKILHPVGGIIAEIRRHEGERVSTGEVVARLDDAVTRTNLELTMKNIDGLFARRARLEAERDGKTEITFPDYLVRRAEDPDVARALTSERLLFEVRSAARRSEKELQKLRIALFQDEISGYQTQASSKDREITLIQQELDGVRQLRDKNLVPMTRLTELERDAVRVNAEQHGAIPVSIAQARGRIADLELQIMAMDRDRGRDASAELREVDARMDEDFRRKATFEDQIRRAEIRAPQDGIIYNSMVRTVGSEVSAGEQLMLVIPTSNRPTVEARIAPRYMDRLQIGQDATLLTAAANQKAAAKFAGRLDAISQQAVRDESSGKNYYTVRFALLSDSDQAGSQALSPGAPVEISINTGNRGFLDEFVKPLGAVAKPLGQRLVGAF